MYAKDSSSAQAAAAAASVIEPMTQDVVDGIIHCLGTRWPDTFKGIAKSDFKASMQRGCINFEHKGVQGKITDKLLVYFMDSQCLGSLFTDVPISCPLNTLHNKIPAETEFKYNQRNECRATLTSTVPGMVISMYTPERHEDATASVAMMGKTFNVTDSKKVLEHSNKFTRSVQDYASKHTNIDIRNMFVNNGTVNITVGAPEGTNDFCIIRPKLLNFAESMRLKKLDGMVYEPVSGCPCAYTPYKTYEDYMNDVLLDDPVYISNPRRFDDCLKFMINYKCSQMPRLDRDADIMSFTNGVLFMSSGVFTAYNEVDAATLRKVARHHISLEYTGDVHTPLLDQVLLAQFSPDVAEVLCALIGRLMFKVGQLDAWQVMPYLVGIGGTGKSLLLNVIQQLFAPGTVGNLAAKREDVFGMANLVDKQVIMGRDMPAKLPGSLPQEIMQGMTAGEGMEIPRKSLKALNVTWTAPVIMASNHMPDYVNTGNNIGRRLVTFRFDNAVNCPSETLQQDLMEELPNIICRALRVYADLRSRVRSAGGFWKSVPPIMLEWQSKLAAATNKLHEFLEMDEDEREIEIVKKPGHITWMLDFKQAFEMSCRLVSLCPDRLGRAIPPKLYYTTERQ